MVLANENIRDIKMEGQIYKNEYFRYLLIFRFIRDGKDARATETACEICIIYQVCRLILAVHK